jgi:hypothetical protein
MIKLFRFHIFPETPLNPSSTFSVNDRDVIAETVDGEVIIINLNSGAYYSSDGIGGAIWEQLGRKLSAGQIVAALACRFPKETAIESDILGFVEELQAEQLILEDETAAPAEAVASPWFDGAYTRPRLHKYTDFEDLLKLDPIHEVHEAAGWPAPRADA